MFSLSLSADVAAACMVFSLELEGLPVDHLFGR